MWSFHKMLRAVRLACAWLVVGASPALASEGGTDLFSANVLSVTADVRAVAVDGEQSWIDDGFGKLRYGGDDPLVPSDAKFQPEFAEANLIWQPRLSWTLSGTVVGTVQTKQKLEASLSEAFLTFKPLSDGATRWSVRAGLMWPAVSLEHSGPEWAVTETITPSAINSWIGEEVKVVGIDATVSTRLGDHKLEATAGVFDVNDTAGTLLAFRGWALHDEKALAFRKQPLPVLNDFIRTIQPRFTTPLITFSGQDTTGGFGKRPGYYAKLVWEPANLPIRIEAFRYDNNADPEHINANFEWGWRTRFNNLGLIADPGPNTQVRAQGMQGNTLMGFRMNGVITVDTDYRAAFVMVTHRLGKLSLTGRVEAFGARNHGSGLTAEDDEDGWAVTLAAKRSLGRFATGFIEFLHVDSSRNARLRQGIAPNQRQTQVQAALRLKW